MEIVQTTGDSLEGGTLIAGEYIDETQHDANVTYEDEIDHGPDVSIEDDGIVQQLQDINTRLELIMQDGGQIIAETETRGNGDGEILVDETAAPSPTPSPAIAYTEVELLMQINDNIYAATSIAVGMAALIVGVIMGIEVLRIWLR